MSAKADRARVRGYEKREAGWWTERGFTVDLSWNECRGFIRTARGTVPIIKRRDFFGHFDLMGVRENPSVFVGVQVTESPFVQERSGRADRNAEHGEPPFPWVPPSVPVEEWLLDPALHIPRFVQVIVSYADSRHPDRRWWFQK